jgi:AraC-like DNA-binding protein
VPFVSDPCFSLFLDLQVQQLADAVGFKRPGDLATAFRLRFGMTPMQYRKQQRQGRSA